MKFSDSELAQAWISQFRNEDQPTAVELLDHLAFVPNETFLNGIQGLIRQLLAENNQKWGFYAERQVPRVNLSKRPKPIFDEALKRPHSAIGSGPSPLTPATLPDSQVGSEGFIAQLLTSICRAFPDKAFNHPGPADIRKFRISNIAIVTDFIGSGDRIYSYLESFRMVRSVRSWFSLRYLRFHVIAYTAADYGRYRVSHHKFRPQIHLLSPCPTIYNQFEVKEDRLRIVDLCYNYDPRGKSIDMSLGYGGVAALIAFRHGVPNNVPRIFTTSSGPNLINRWVPLFRRRSTVHIQDQVWVQSEEQAVSEALQRLHAQRMILHPWLKSANSAQKKLALVLSFLSKNIRTEERLSLKTGLPVPAVREAMARALQLNWVNDVMRLTDQGQREVAHLRRKISTRIDVASTAGLSYYPTQLRSPKTVF